MSEEESWLNAEEEEEWIGTAGEFEESLAAPESIEDDPYFFVRTRTTDKGDIWHASRVGDLTRLKQLLEAKGVDVNQRDRWDSTPLYYACLAGHCEVAECLLEAGASCSDFTFDGERCYYVALTQAIKQLLLAHAQRPPPLPPLGSSLRGLCSLCEDPEAQIQPAVLPGSFSDLSLQQGGQHIQVHQAILAARSPFFRRRLCDGTLPIQEGPSGRVLHLSHPLHSEHPSAIRALIVWMYTERLEVGMSDVEAVRRLAKRLRLRALVTALENEQYTHKYYFKSVRREELPRRFILQASSIPPSARLSADLEGLMRRSEQAAAHLKDPRDPADDFADSCLRVEGRIFRCHRCILAARSDYFAALFKRADSFGTGDGAAGRGSSQAATSQLPTIDVGGVSAKVMQLVLRYAYTDSPTEQERLPGWLMRQIPEGVQEIFDAAELLLLFSLKREVAEALLRKFEARPQLQGGLEGICRLLLIADSYRVPLLRDHCLQRLAARYTHLANRVAPQQEQLLFSEFLAAVAPQGGDLLDGSNVAGASKGNIVGGGVGGAGQGTLLQDLREAYLDNFKGDEWANRRDECAKEFDERLEALAARSLTEGTN